VVSVFVFFALNPAWWDAPLSRTREVLELRRSIVAGQTTTFAASAYADVGDRITGMLAHLSSDGPQYSESPGWPEALGAEVRTYRDSLWSGVPYGGGPFPTLLGFALFALTVLGAVRLVRDLRSEDAGAWLLLAWAVATAGFILLAIPLDWQRYYVPLYPIQMILAGAGASGLVAIARRGRWGGLDGSAP
jgi:4-amino-4-deoxy-L-arabinose transferase-like glycosyltransferase